MRDKDNPLRITNPVSARIVSELIKRNGNDKLYDLCSSINIHQGTMRRRLEASDRSWAAAEDLMNIASYLNVDFEWLLTGQSKQTLKNNEIKKWMRRALEAENLVKKLKKTNSKLKAALALLQGIPE